MVPRNCSRPLVNPPLCRARLSAKRGSAQLADLLRHSLCHDVEKARAEAADSVAYLKPLRKHVQRLEARSWLQPIQQRSQSACILLAYHLSDTDGA